MNAMLSGCSRESSYSEKQECRKMSTLPVEMLAAGGVEGFSRSFLGMVKEEFLRSLCLQANPLTDQDSIS